MATIAPAEPIETDAKFEVDETKDEPGAKIKEPEQGDGEEAVEQHDDESNEHHEEEDLVALAYEPHGGDPRTLDLTSCILLSCLPSGLLDDKFELFDDCIRCLFADEYATSKTAIDRIVRIPILEYNSDNSDNCLRAIISFKVKLHKHRLLSTKKKEIEEGGYSIEPIEKIPDEFLDFEEGGHEELEVEEVKEEDESNDIQVVEEKGKTSTPQKIKDPVTQKSSKDSTKDSKKVKEEPAQKVYVDEDKKAPFEVVWDGAPEFQWRLVEAPKDRVRLTIENIFYNDIFNPFIYRTMIKAESVDISFPMRYNHDGTKEMHGRMTLLFADSETILKEAMKHLIYVRTPAGRRIKIYLPQTTYALKRKDDFEKLLGRVIKPTARMHELVIKVLPKNVTPTVDDAYKWFPNQSVLECHIEKDEDGQPCAIVKFETVEEAIAAHSSTSSITFDDENKARCNVYMRGVEAHYGSLLTLADDRRRTREGRKTIIRSRRDRGAVIADPEPKRRPPIVPTRGRGAPRGSLRGSRGSRGGYLGSRPRGSSLTRPTSRVSTYRRERTPPRPVRASYARTERELEEQLNKKRNSQMSSSLYERSTSTGLYGSASYDARARSSYTTTGAASAQSSYYTPSSYNIPTGSSTYSTDSTYGRY